MSKYDRDIQDVYAVKQLGDAIGYGHLMAIAHELWARHLESKGLPRRGAHCVVGYPMVKEQFQAEALNDKIYTIIVGKALEADRKTEPNLSDIPTSSDEPETERYCTNCKHNGVIEDYECRECHGMDKHEFIEPQTETPTNSEKVQLKVQLTDEPQTEREGE